MNLGKIGKKDPTLHDGLPVRLPRAPKQVLLGLGRDWGWTPPLAGGRYSARESTSLPDGGMSLPPVCPAGYFRGDSAGGLPMGWSSSAAL